MAVECIVISAIILIMSLTFHYRKHTQWMWATLPLGLVPTCYFLMYLIGYFLKLEITVTAAIIVILTALGISCLWLGLVSNCFKNTKTRVTYIVISDSFNVALAAILLIESLG